MGREILNKTYSKPRDMFDDACFLIANELEKYGFKYSKSQSTIKKKDKIFTYVISFHSSHYNYIIENEGHVAMEFYCTIEHKKEIIFRLNQKELRSEVHSFELFDNKTEKIDAKNIEDSLDFVKTHFLPVIFSLQNAPNTFVKNVANQPIVRADNYGFQYDKKIFEIFNHQNLIEKHDEKTKEFKSNVPKEDRIRFKKYILHQLDENKLQIFNTEELQSTLQNLWPFTHKMKSEVLEIYYEDLKKLFEELVQDSIANKTDWLIEYYTLMCFIKEYIENKKLKEDCYNFIEQFKNCLQL